MLYRRNILICLVAVCVWFVGIESAEACGDWDLFDCYVGCNGYSWLFCGDCLEDSLSLGGHPGAASFVYPQPIPWHGSLIEVSWDGGEVRLYARRETLVVASKLKAYIK